MAFVSSYLSIHVAPLCQELYEQLEGRFHYIAIDRISEWRIKSGYSDLDQAFPFVIRAYEEEERALKVAQECDVLIIGSAQDKYIEKRLKANKLTFRYSERFYRNKLTLRKLPKEIARVWYHHTRFRHKPLYMLCASAYTADDCLKFGNYRGKLFRWGYFPQTFEYNMEALMQQKRREPVEILWVARLIELKHPMMAIEAADYLRKEGIPFHLSLVGTGELEEEIRESVKAMGLEDCVELVGVVPSSEVRQYMERASVFLFTSDYQEGWGAVLNEAMNSGCASVVSSAIGSAPFLIEDGVNGLLFENGNQDQLNDCVKKLVVDSEYRERIGNNAYRTIVEKWNARSAARRLLNLIANIDNAGSLYKDGPCSPAERIRDGR